MSEEVVQITTRCERAYRHLHKTSKRVYSTFASGHHPSFEQLDALKASIEALELQKLCGHLAVEDCQCGGHQ